MNSRFATSITRHTLSLKRQVSAKLARYSCKPIAIVGLSRGGTTHLVELINDTSCNVCWEPLTNADYQSRYRRLFCNEIGDPPFIPHDSYSELASAYFSRVFSGKVNHPAYVSGTPQQIGAKCLIVKFCRGGGLLPYFAQHHDVVLIHLVRSPFAVIASQLRFPSYCDLEVISDTTTYIHGNNSARLIERWGSLISSVKTKEEMLAIWWCLNHAATLSEDPRGRWENLFYEDLHLNTSIVANSLYQVLTSRGARCASPDDMASRLCRPSATVKADSPFAKTGNYDQFSWAKELNGNQIKIIAETISAFGLESLMHKRWLP
jgi:hypothetical protein